MSVARPQLGNEGLTAPSNQVILEGPISGLAYPDICPNCGAQAHRALTIAKPFMYSSGGDTGWSHCVTQARPLFCEPCHLRHASEAIPVTDADRMKSLFSQPLLIPALGLVLFGGSIILDRAFAVLKDPIAEWPIIALAIAMLLIGRYCAQLAWREGSWARIPLLTPTSSAFDFSDDDDSLFQRTARIYAIRNAACAVAFKQLNAKGY